jgi:phosphodiesterase/alkaline phosphatase D-like protein
VNADEPRHSEICSISRREFFKGAGVAGVAAATAPLALAGEASGTAAADGTPEQIHLTWGDDPSRTVFVSWASPAQAVAPRVIVQHAGDAPIVIHAVQRTYSDGINGQTVFTYHAKLDGLAANTVYH